MSSNALPAANFSPSAPIPITGTLLGALKQKFPNHLEPYNEIEATFDVHL
jgi:hypothetical protein